MNDHAPAPPTASAADARRSRCPASTRAARPANKGQKFPATPPTTEEVAAMLALCDRATPYGLRLFSWLLLDWRTGLRISESLALTETDLNPADSTVYVRCGKGGKSRLVGIDDWVWPDCSRGSSTAARSPSARCSASSRARPPGRRWSTSGRPQEDQAARGRRRHPPPRGAPPAAPRARGRAAAGGDEPGVHPAPARPHEPRDHDDVLPGAAAERRHRRDPPAPGAAGQRDVDARRRLELAREERHACLTTEQSRDCSRWKHTGEYPPFVVRVIEDES
jgi:integrase